ncbi:PREDICTED: TLD domain-containing protein 1 [Rhagoletis zephyria]|uniref:TLD domain-containing protein 1 n=1 Tax=Rhagoletis zephyria TaxID=28612 RepID=UPI0008116263|nr:PREDICTED: TLD domain-containing protein 1 [Rhagoletis zephyria]
MLLQHIFTNLSGFDEKSWSNIIDPHLAQCTANFLFKLVGQVTPVISLDRYAEPYYIVERGAIDDKVNFLATSLEQSDTNQFTIKELEYYVAAVLKSYLKSLQSMEAFESWNQHGYQSSDRSVYAFSRGLIRSMSQDHDHFLNLRMLEEWLRVNPTFLILWRDVFTYVYSKKSSKSFKSGIGLSCNLLPVLDGLATGTNYTPILDIPHIIFVNSNLPNEYRNKWRFLFSSKIMGESFSTMLAKIVNKGPTLLVVEDEDRYVFAGFCPVSWSLKSQFFGNESSMLYTLSPEMRCFNSTGYNDHYQYLNLNQQTMPNGLGMGGQLYYWGLWIDSDYGLGQSSESCTSFRDYVQLSKKQNFRIRNMEVWGIGEEPKDEDYEYGEGDGKNSILDTNLEDKVMLQLAGKEIYSEGLREPDMDF